MDKISPKSIGDEATNVEVSLRIATKHGPVKTQNSHPSMINRLGSNLL